MCIFFLNPIQRTEPFPAKLANKWLKTSSGATRGPHLEQSKHQCRRLPCGAEDVARKRSLLSSNIRTELPQGFYCQSNGTNRGEKKQKPGFLQPRSLQFRRRVHGFTCTLGASKPARATGNRGTIGPSGGARSEDPQLLSPPVPARLRVRENPAKPPWRARLPG